MMARASATPSPVPPSRVVKKGDPTRDSRCSGMPRPVSRMTSSPPSPSRRSCTVTDPPEGVASMALVSRFKSASLSRRPSPTSDTGSPSRASTTPALSARPSSTAMTSSTSGPTATGPARSASSGRENDR
jgi:hypothetical protein